MSTRLRSTVIGSLTTGVLAAAVVFGSAGSASAAHAYRDHLVKGESLRAGEYIERQVLTGGTYRLVMQADGNLVEYRYDGKTTKVCWASNTRYAGGTYVVYQQDGNFVMYPDWSTHAVWSSNTYGGAGTTVDMNKFGGLYVGTTQIGNQCF